MECFCENTSIVDAWQGIRYDSKPTCSRRFDIFMLVSEEKVHLNKS